MATEDHLPSLALASTQLERRAAERELVQAEIPSRRRRLRDRLEGEDQGGLLVNSSLAEVDELKNPLLICDDDLRQTAKALGDIESYVLSALRVLEKRDLSRADLSDLLKEDLMGKIDTLTDSLGSLRKSLGLIAEKVA